MAIVTWQSSREINYRKIHARQSCKMNFLLGEVCVICPQLVPGGRVMEEARVH